MSTKFSLRIVGQNSSRRFELAPGDVSQAGRAVESHILIPDPNISRQQFTIFARDEHLDIVMNPQSPNQLLKNGQVVTAASMYPGEFFDIGPYRFELESTEDLPQVEVAGLPADPAGAIDIRLAAEVHRIAPRWSTVAKVDEVAPSKVAAGIGSGMKKTLLSVASIVVAGVLGWDFIMDEPAIPKEAPAAVVSANELLESIKAPNCQNPDACLNVANESIQVGEKLRMSGARDLTTLYRIAKQFHRAKLAIKGHEDKLPKLQESDRQARVALSTALADLQFRLERAKEEGDLNRQLITVQAMLAICAEDRLKNCTDWERTNQQLRERQMMR